MPIIYQFVNDIIAFVETIVALVGSTSLTFVLGHVELDSWSNVCETDE